MMYRSIAVRIDSVEGHFDHFAYSVLIDVIHRKCGDIIFAENFLFFGVDITKADISDSIGTKAFWYLTISGIIVADVPKLEIPGACPQFQARRKQAFREYSRIRSFQEY